MKKILHRAQERGIGDHSWLKSRFSFSFADWYHPDRMGFGALRVINDDQIAPSSGFGAHSHRDMEISTIVTKGVVTHEDSMGTKGSVGPSEVQVMTAGTGVVHSEKNISPNETLELFQLWILPSNQGLAPAYAQASFVAADGATVLVSPYGYAEGLHIHQDAFITRLNLSKGNEVTYEMRVPGNGMYVFVVAGVVDVEEETLSTRDALGLVDIKNCILKAKEDSEMLVIEVPMH